MKEKEKRKGNLRVTHMCRTDKFTHTIDWNFDSGKYIVKAYLRAIIRALRGTYKQHTARWYCSRARDLEWPWAIGRKKASCHCGNCPNSSKSILCFTMRCRAQSGSPVPPSKPYSRGLRKNFNRAARLHLHSLTSRSADCRNRATIVTIAVAFGIAHTSEIRGEWVARGHDAEHSSIVLASCYIIFRLAVFWII